VIMARTRHKLTGRWITLRRDATCRRCGGALFAGEAAYWVRRPIGADWPRGVYCGSSDCGLTVAVEVLGRRLEAEPPPIDWAGMR